MWGQTPQPTRTCSAVSLWRRRLRKGCGVSTRTSPELCFRCTSTDRGVAAKAHSSALLRDELERGKPEWLIIDSNAWRQSRVGTPWWSLLAVLRHRLASSRRLPARVWLRLAEALHSSRARNRSVQSPNSIRRPGRARTGRLQKRRPTHIGIDPRMRARGRLIRMVGGCSTYVLLPADVTSGC